MSAILQLSAPVVDIVYRVVALPRSGEEAEVTGFATHTGGGFNSMAAARAAGADVVHGGSLGTGPLADSVRAELRRHGIGIAGAQVPDRDQGCCTVLVEPSGERSFVSAVGAEGLVRRGDLDALPLGGIGAVLLSGYTLHYPEACEAVTEWACADATRPPLIFDPSPLVASIPAWILDAVLARSAWVSANAAEAAVLTGENDPEQAARALAEGRGGALVRTGAGGCVLAEGGSVTRIPGHPVEALDTNGAGDTHLGSFAAELLRHGNGADAARYANVAAALSVTRQGPATAPAREEVEAILERQPHHAD